MRGPLSGIRILEVGVMLAGPYATMMLADLGAEVIKIEPPGGEISRQVGPSYFASLNRNKRSVRLDLASESGQARLGERVAESDALLVNMKPSVIAAVEAESRQRDTDDPVVDYVIQAATGVAAR